MLESEFQAKLIKDLKKAFPGCMVLKNDSAYISGIPDLLVLFNDRWAALEVKISEDAPFQPNQPYYVEKMALMSYAAFIFPENQEEIFDELQFTFRTRRSTRVPKRKQVPLDELHG